LLGNSAPAVAAWQLRWLRLHLGARELMAVSLAMPEWPEVKRKLDRCAEPRRAMIQAGWFNISRDRIGAREVSS
jgi:hypothetical protein